MMRVMSLDRPYSGLIAEGFKWIDTRGKPYPWRGAIGERIGIHATKKPPVVRGDIGEFQVWNESGAVWWLDGRDGDVESNRYWALVPSAIVATARIEAVVPIVAEVYVRLVPRLHSVAFEVDPESRRTTLVYTDDRGRTFDVTDQYQYGIFHAERYALILADVEKLDDPVPCPGRQLLWHMPPNVEHAVRAQVDRQRGR